MSDDTTNQQEPTPASEPSTPEVTTPNEQKGTQITDPTVLQAELDKARAEAAKYRTERTELKEAADKWSEYQEAQKTEQQRITEQNELLQRQLEEQRLSNLRNQAALHYGLTADDLDLLGTGSPDEINARAQRLQSLHQAAQTTPPPSQTPNPSLRSGAGEREPEKPDDSFPSSWVV